MATRKTVIITGAASGLGRAMALGLLGAGIDVAAVDRTAAGLEFAGRRGGGAAGRGADHAGRPAAARRVRPHRRRGAGPQRPDRRAGEQRRDRPGLGAGRCAQPADPLLGSDAGAMEPLPGGERHRADHDGARRAAAHAGGEGGPHHHRHHQPRHHGARGLPAVRRQQGRGRGGDGRPVRRPERHRRHVERAGAGRGD